MLSKETVQKALVDRNNAPISEKVRGMLNFLEKLTLTPEQIGSDDIVPLRQIGISDQAIEDALYISSFFQIINRLADAFNVAVPTEEIFAHTADRLLTYGYQ